MEPKKTTPETPLQQLRGYLIANDYAVPENEADFSGWVQEDGRLNRLHKVLLDDKEGAEVTPDFARFQQELLGDVKKKSGGADSSTGLPNDPASPANGSASPALPPGDAPFESVPLPAQPPTELAPPPSPFQPEVGPPQPEGAVAPGLQGGTVVVGAPGVDVSSAPYSEDMQRLAELRPPTAPEQTALDALPALNPSEYPKTLGTQPAQLEDATDLVMLPRDHKAGLPAGLQADEFGNQYFRRPLSNKVNGKEQSRGEAMLAAYNNNLREVGQGLAKGLQAVGNVGLMGTNPVAAAGNPLTFGDEASAFQEKLKTPIAPVYTAPGRQNVNTVAVKAAGFAPMVAMQVVQTLAPELRAPAAIERLLTLGATVGFDAPLIHGASERAHEAGLQGQAAELYTVFESAVTLGAFKLGGKLINAGGDAAVLKLAPKEFAEQVALEATQQATKMSTQLGRALTQAEQQGVLSQTLKGALPKLAQFAKGTLQQAVTLPLAGTATALANQALAPALGGTAEELTPEKFGKDRLREFGEGLVMGSVTETVGAGLDAAGALRRTPLSERQAAQRRRAPEGTKVVPAERTLSQLKGNTVLVRDNDGMTRLGAVHNIVEQDGKRSYIVRDADGKLSRHAQGEVFANDSSAPSAGPPTPAPAAAPAPAPTPAPAPAAPRPAGPERPPRAAEASPVAEPNTGPTLAELVPDNQPVSLDFGGEPVQAFRNAEGDIELRHTASNQVTVLDKGDQFDKPAADFLLGPPAAPIAPAEATTQAGTPEPATAAAGAAPATVRIKPGDTLTLGSGEFATDHEIEDVLRDKDGQIVAAMVAGRNGSRIIEPTTQEGQAAIADLNAREQQLAPEPTPEPAAAAPEPVNEPAPTPTAPEIAASPEPSAPEPAAPAASAPDAATGPLPAAEPAAAEAETPEAKAPLPAAAPHPDHVKTLTAKQTATNAALDALDRFNALNKTEQKTPDGKARRKELIQLAGKAGLKIKDLSNGKAAIDGPRVTRSNEYTATTPANDHVPLSERPAEARPFMEKVLEGADEDASKLQGLGITMRGKELSGRELRDAAKDIKEGRNTLRAQMVLDALENAHRKGVFRQTTGTGLGVQAHEGTIEEYMGAEPGTPAGRPVDLTDAELDAIYESDPKAKQAVDDYAFSDGSIDYARLANDEHVLPFLFDVTDETATKLTQLARERAQQTTDPREPTNQAGSERTDAGEPAQSPAGTDEVSPPSPSEVAPLADTNVGQSKPSLAEQNIAAKQEFAAALAEFRAARKKSSGLALSTAVPLPTFSAEEVAALTKMAKAIIKRGSIKTKQVIAEMRALGFSDDDGTDAQLKPVIQQLLTDEGLRQPKAPKAPKAAATEAPANPTDPTNTKQRQGAESIKQSGLSDELYQGLVDKGADRYTPKPLAETAAHVDRIIASEGIDRAYYTATHGSNDIPKDVLEVLRIRVMAHYDNVARQLRADPTANGPAIAEAVERSVKVAESYTTGGSEAARQLRARQLLDQYAPAVAVARMAAETKDTNQQAVETLKPKAKREAKRVRRQKAAALDAALASPGVQATLGAGFDAPAAAPRPAATTTATPRTAPDPPTWGSKNKLFSEANIEKARAALKRMGLAAGAPPELVFFLGYHIEAGARSFADVSARAVRDLGQKVKPLLPEAYELAKKEFIKRGGDNTGFDGPDAVEAVLRGELADDLAERIVAAAQPAKPGVFDPVRDMLDTLTKKVSEKLPDGPGKPRDPREVLAAALNNRAEYADVFEQSKALVDAKIDKLKLSDPQKQKLRDALQDYHAEIIGQPYADQQFARAYREGESEVLKNYAGRHRGQQLDAAATASDGVIARDRQRLIDHVTQGVTDPQTKQELADHVGREFDQRLADRQRALRVKAGVGHVQPTVAADEQAAGPAAPSNRQRAPMSRRVQDLLNTRATDERVAAKLAPAAVREGLAAQGKRLQQIARDHLNDPTDTGRTLAEAFVQDAGLGGKRAQVFAKAIEQEFAREIAKAQDAAVRDAYRRAVRTKEPKAAQDLSDRVRKLYTLSPTDEGRVLGLVADQANLPELTPADNSKLYQLADAISQAKGDQAKARAVHAFYLGIKGIRGLSGWEQVKTVMYANMLSGLSTQLKNVNSTGLNTLADLVYSTGWAGYLAVGHAIRTRDVRALGLIGAPAKGIFNRSGADRAYQMLTTGVRPPGYEGKFDEASDLEVLARMTPQNRKQAIMKGYANLIKYVPRMLSANDLMWSGGAEQMWAYNMALTDAVQEGRNLPTDQIWASVNERLYGTSVRLADAQTQATQELGPGSGAAYNGQYRMRVQELMEASRNERLSAQSKRAAAETTFNGPMEGFIGQVMSKLGQLTEAEIGRGAQPLKGVVPFTRVVANVTNAFLNYTPVGYARAAKGKIGWNGNSFERQYTPMERSIVAAKALTGTIVMAAVYQLLDEDKLTGNGPSDPAANRAWQQRGHRPYTIGGWNYKDSPFYYPLAAVAALKEAQAYDGADFDNDPVFAKKAGRMLAATTQAGFASLSLTNLQDFMNALSDPSKGKDPAERMGRYVERTVGAVASSVLLPGSGFLRGLSRFGQQMAGSTKREGTDVWGMLGQDVPFARNELPRVYDDLGNEVPVGSTIPFVPTPDIPDETGATQRINTFLDKHHLFIKPINRYQSDMQVLQARVGKLSADERGRMRTMTDAEKKKYLLTRLGGEAPMPAEQWQQFYAKRGRLIKEKMLLHLPELERLAASNPRKLRKRLNKLYQQATTKAKRGIDFTDPGVLPPPGSDD